MTRGESFVGGQNNVGAGTKMNSVSSDSIPSVSPVPKPREALNGRSVDPNPVPVSSKCGAACRVCKKDSEEQPEVPSQSTLIGIIDEFRRRVCKIGYQVESVQLDWLGNSDVPEKVKIGINGTDSSSGASASSQPKSPCGPAHPPRPQDMGNNRFQLQTGDHRDFAPTCRSCRGPSCRCATPRSYESSCVSPTLRLPGSSSVPARCGLQHPCTKRMPVHDNRTPRSGLQQGVAHQSGVSVHDQTHARLPVEEIKLPAKTTRRRRPGRPNSLRLQQEREQAQLLAAMEYQKRAMLTADSEESLRQKRRITESSELRRKSAGKSATYCCIYCGNTFWTQVELSEHSTIHGQQRPYGCRICGARFYLHEQLVLHVRVIHSGEVS